MLNRYKSLFLFFTFNLFKMTKSKKDDNKEVARYFVAALLGTLCGIIIYHDVHKVLTEADKKDR